MINRLKEFRKRIDDIDLALIDLLEKRLEITKEIAEFKKQNDIQIEDSNREYEITDHLSSIVSEENKALLTKRIVEDIWKNIFAMTKKGEKKKSFNLQPALDRISKMTVEEYEKLYREAEKSELLTEMLHLVENLSKVSDAEYEELYKEAEDSELLMGFLHIARPEKCLICGLPNINCRCPVGTKEDPYKCPACGHGLAYVNAPCVNPKCSEGMKNEK
jgi:chorismate mutase